MDHGCGRNAEDQPTGRRIEKRCTIRPRGDGHDWIWAERLDPASRHPLGDAFAVHHFHGREYYRYNGWSVAGGRIAIVLNEERGNVWIPRGLKGINLFMMRLAVVWCLNLWITAFLCAQQWPYYGGDAGGMKYSRLKEINRTNVGQLRVAWTFRSRNKISSRRRQLSPLFKTRHWLLTASCTSPLLSTS